MLNENCGGNPNKSKSEVPIITFNQVDITKLSFKEIKEVAQSKNPADIIILIYKLSDNVDRLDLSNEELKKLSKILLDGATKQVEELVFNLLRKFILKQTLKDISDKIKGVLENGKNNIISQNSTRDLIYISDKIKKELKSRIKTFIYSGGVNIPNNFEDLESFYETIKGRLIKNIDGLSFEQIKGLCNEIGVDTTKLRVDSLDRILKKIIEDLTKRLEK